MRRKGSVKWYNPTKGYGFISPLEGGKDVFVHVTALADIGEIREGDVVSYEIEEGHNGKVSAVRLERAEESVQ